MRLQEAGLQGIALRMRGFKLSPRPYVQRDRSYASSHPTVPWGFTFLPQSPQNLQASTVRVQIARRIGP